MQSEQKKEFLLTGAYYAVLAAALYLFLRYLLWWLLPFLLAFAAARAMEPVILLLRRTVHFKRGFSAALLTLFLLFLLGGLLSLLLSALFTEATAFLTQLPTLLDALPALTGGLLDRLRAYGALCPDWLRELLTAELSDWAAYGSTALAGLASRALALLGSMAAAVPALVLFAATTLLAVFFLAASYPTLCAAAKRRLSPRAQQRLRFWRDGVTHSLTRWLRAQAILCSLTFCQLLAGFWLLGARRAAARLGSPRGRARHPLPLHTHRAQHHRAEARRRAGGAAAHRLAHGDVPRRPRLRRSGHGALPIAPAARRPNAAYKKGRLDVSLPFSIQFYAAVLSSQLRKSVPCSGDTSSNPSGSVGSVSPAGTQLPFSS